MGEEQVIPPRESLAFFRSFNTLCPNPILTSKKSMVFRSEENPPSVNTTMKKLQIFSLLTRKFGKRSSAVIWGKISFLSEAINECLVKCGKLIQYFIPFSLYIHIPFKGLCHEVNILWTNYKTISGILCALMNFYRFLKLTVVIIDCRLFSCFYEISYLF